jgi:synaptobrevin family protein YKT6
MGMTMRWTVLPLLQPVIKEIVETTKRGGRQHMVTETGTHAADAFHHPDGIVGVIGSEAGYDQVAAQMILNKVMDMFLESTPKSEWQSGSKKVSVPKVDGQSPLVKYKDPGQINKLAAIQKDLDDTLETMRHTIQQTTMRGERLDELVNKSENLNSASKMFYQQAKKQNSCCVLM